MSYENKKYILQFFEGVHEEENRAELIEVYRKAEAFDAIHEVKIKAIKECDYLISPKFFKMFGMKAYRKLEEIEEEHESGESDD